MDAGSTNALQLLLVIAPDWTGRDARLFRYTRHDALGQWLTEGEAIPVSLGRSGLAPAACLADDNAGAPPPKREGDGRSPAGICSAPRGWELIRAVPS